MIEIPQYYTEKLSPEESTMAVVLLEDVKEAEEKWMDAIEALLPVKAKIRCLVNYIDTAMGCKSNSFFDKLSKKIKYALNIGKVNDKVKEAETEYKRLKEDNKNLYDKEAEAKKKLENAEQTLFIITFQSDEVLVPSYVMQSQKERENFIEETVKKYMSEIEKSNLLKA